MWSLASSAHPGTDETTNKEASKITTQRPFIEMLQSFYVGGRRELPTAAREASGIPREGLDYFVGVSGFVSPLSRTAHRRSGRIKRANLRKHA